jgi:hypothetical protein
MKLKSVSTALSGIAGVLAIFSMAACASQADKQPGTAGDPQVSAVQFAQTAADFDSDSVRITGTRSGTANATHCVNSATGCFNFLPGNPIPEPVAGSGAEDFDRLCPTSATNSPPGGTGEWTFTYAIFAEPNCTGDQVNSPETDTLVCFAENDLATKSHPNQTVNEVLPAGIVVNTILCLAQNTEKKFDFNICTQLNIPELPAGNTAYNCGCERPGTPGTQACTCPWFAEQGVTTPPEGCHFDEDCNLICTTEHAPDGGLCVCDDTFIPVTCSNHVTYPNLCFARCAGATGCNGPVAPDGGVCACDDTFRPVTCPDGSIWANQCIADCAGLRGCVDQSTHECACDDTFVPVICTGPDGDQIEYANPCVAACAGARNCQGQGTGPDGGVCACDDTFIPVVCFHNGQPSEVFPNLCFAVCAGFQLAECHQPTAPDGGVCACDTVYLPVTCSDGNTYANLCVAQCAGQTNCNGDCACDFTYLPVTCSGPTEPPITFANQCAADCAGATGCHPANAVDGGACACPFTYLPVVCTGPDGHTLQVYANSCVADCAGATNCHTTVVSCPDPAACDLTFIPVLCHDAIVYANICIANCAGQTTCVEVTIP